MPHYLRTNETEEAVSSMELVFDSVNKAKHNVYYWKWAIIGLHNAVQGFMVLALRGGNGLAVLEDRNARAWIEAYESDKTYPIERLDGFFNLYRKIKSSRMEIYCHSRRFVPTGTEDASISRLNSLRNEFIHFTPKGWCLEVSGLPKIFADCLDVIWFLGWESGNILWMEDPLKSRGEQAIQSTRTALRDLADWYGDSE